jgi:biotin carboxyl carrier protein
MADFHVTVDGNEYQVAITPGNQPVLAGLNQSAQIQAVGEHLFSVILGSRSFTVLACRTNGGFEVLCDGRYHHVQVDTERGRLLKKYSTGRGGKARHTEIHAPMPAMVIRVEVAPGDEVKEGQGLVILEAMKMENEIKAQHSGRVKAVRVEKGKAVEKGELLIEME